MSDIRTCTVDDIPAVARMFQSAFRDKRQAPPASLESYLRELFLEHPWYDPEMASRVYTGADGAVHGFIGQLPIRMSFRGQPIRASLASSLVVDNPAEHPMAGARLLRSYLVGPQDLCISETSNLTAQGMWERSGGRSIAEYSMEWIRIMRPVSFGTAWLERKCSPAKMLRPLSSFADRLIKRVGFSTFAPRASSSGSYSDGDVDDEALLEQIPSFAATYDLHPDWERDSLAFILRHSAQKSSHGTLYRRMVYGRNKEPVGCYLYYCRPGGIAWVLQILALPGSVDAVVSSLMAHAWELGAAALRGRTQPKLLNALLRNGCILFQSSWMTVYSKDADLIAAIRSGDAFIVGLAGEGWTRLIGENFA
jgi:hypothetical protein